MTHQGGEPDPEDGNVNDCALHEVLRRDKGPATAGQDNAPQLTVRANLVSASSSLVCVEISCIHPRWTINRDPSTTP